MSVSVVHLVAWMQHEEKGFSCAIERLTGPEGVGKEGPKYLTKKRNSSKNTVNIIIKSVFKCVSSGW